LFSFCFVDLFSYHFFSPSLVVFFFPCGFVCFIIYDCYYFFSHVLRRIAHPMVSLFHPTRSPTKSNQKSIWGLNDIIETRKRKPKKKNNGGNSLVLPSKKSNCYQHPVILLISFFFHLYRRFFYNFAACYVLDYLSTSFFFSSAFRQLFSRFNTITLVTFLPSASKKIRRLNQTNPEKLIDFNNTNTNTHTNTHTHTKLSNLFYYYYYYYSHN